MKLEKGNFEVYMSVGLLEMMNYVDYASPCLISGKFFFEFIIMTIKNTLLHPESLFIKIMEEQKIL